MTYTEWGLIALCVVLALVPPKWDPAIRLKEWIDTWGNLINGDKDV